MAYRPTTHISKFFGTCDGVELENRKCFIYARSKWSEDCVEMLLQETKSGKCYKGMLSRQEMKKTATDLEIPFEEYYTAVLTALTAKTAMPAFEYEIDETEQLFKLKLNRKQKFRIPYVEMELQEVPNNFEILDTAIKLICSKQHG